MAILEISSIYQSSIYLPKSVTIYSMIWTNIIFLSSLSTDLLNKYLKPSMSGGPKINSILFICSSLFSFFQIFLILSSSSYLFLSFDNIFLLVLFQSSSSLISFLFLLILTHLARLLILLLLLFSSPSDFFFFIMVSFISPFTFFLILFLFFFFFFFSSLQHFLVKLLFDYWKNLSFLFSLFLLSLICKCELFSLNPNICFAISPDFSFFFNNRFSFFALLPFSFLSVELPKFIFNLQTLAFLRIPSFLTMREIILN
ncbi:unnamed protein product [Acanthosepion pharaonis]|uniref:Uncharacterized protein n=1 Tax=Acanthosepion pharaonis TaxID=158019 RepID=A0A812DSN2_ACAPH|nr:unnamed protein product [Sepia pharaonis]